MVKIIRSITKSIGHGIKNDPEVSRLKNKYPKTFGFLRKRFAREHKYGLYLTIGTIITLFFVYLFIIIHKSRKGTNDYLIYIIKNKKVYEKV